MTTAPSLTSLVIRLRGLKPMSQMRREMAQLGEKVSQAARFVAPMEIGIQATKLISPEIKNSDLARFLIENGLPFPKGQDKIWIDAPNTDTNRDERVGYLFEKEPGRNSVTITSVLSQLSTDKATDLTAGEPLPDMCFPFTKENVLLEYLPLRYRLTLSDDLEASHDLSLVNPDDLFRYEESVSKMTGGFDNRMNHVFIESVMNRKSSIGRRALMYLTLLRHEQMWQKKNGAHIGKVHSNSSGIRPYLSDAYRRVLTDKKTPDKIKAFLSIKPPKPPTIAQIIARQPINPLDAENQRTTELNSNIKRAAKLYFEDDVAAIAQKVMEAVPGSKIDLLFEGSRPKYDIIWTEGAAIDKEPIIVDEQAYTPYRCGGLFHYNEDGFVYDGLFAYLQDDLSKLSPDKEMDFYVTGERITVTTKHRANEEVFLLDDVAPDKRIHSMKNSYRFLETLLLLERKEKEILRACGLLPQDEGKESAPGSPDGTRVRSPYIHRNKLGGIARQITVPADKKTKGVLWGSRREVILKDDLLLRWEEAKGAVRDREHEVLRAVCADAKNPQNLPILMEIEQSFAAAAKELFGDTVTAQITIIPRILVEPEGLRKCYVREPHARVYLVEEFTDPHERMLHQLAYKIKATRKQAQNPDGTRYDAITLSLR